MAIAGLPGVVPGLSGLYPQAAEFGLHPQVLESQAQERVELASALSSWTDPVVPASALPPPWTKLAVQAAGSAADGSRSASLGTATCRARSGGEPA